MRVQYRGGLWTNAEDEVVKAAIAKYGRNQWSRIASLLPRKSAKQVKARWCEWLSPDIRKTEWTREEEEKLLHLAKIMPTQWRTIAPMIGRTAAQCLEHYERLLEDAQRGAGAGASGDAPTAAGGEGRNRFDEMAAETKPARPDAVDMNEEEKEMLSEARARLANTRGKKAKRKAREKQLEAAKRMAQLQKRRELKAAGIIVKPRKAKKGAMDLSTEVPYARAPVPGFYDTREEDEIGMRDKRDVRGLGRLINKYETERREEMVDEDARREAVKRKFVFGDPGDKKGKAEGGAGSSSVDAPPKRSRMTLPAPQVSDADLETIAKAGVRLSDATGAGAGGGVGRSGAQQTGGSLLSGVGHPLLATPEGSIASSLPGTPSGSGGNGSGEMWADVRDRQLKQLMKLQAASTPLVGGDNSALPQSLDVHNSVTPRSTVQRTPNPLATPSFASMRSVATVDTDDTGLVRSEKARLQGLKRDLKKGLDSLPDPENEYVVNVNRVEGGEENSDDGSDGAGDGRGGDGMVEDAEDEVVRLKREGTLALQTAKRGGLSSAARRGLPVPPLSVFPEDMSQEVAELVERDTIVSQIVAECEKHGGIEDGEVAKRIEHAVVLDAGNGNLAAAHALIEEEVTRTKNAGEGVTEAELLKEIKHLRDVDEGRLWVVDENGRITEASSGEDLRNSFRQRAAHASSLKKSVKTAQRNLGKRLHGFDMKRTQLHEELVRVLDLVSKSQQELVCFSQLADAEAAAVPRRVAEMEAAVRGQKVLERRLQQQYALATGSAR